MLSLDLAALAHDALLEQRRPEDGMLHPSTDIAGPLRHTQLRMAGAPQKPERLASIIRLNTGTMWHSWFGEMLERKGVPVMREISATPGLPEGWAGTADFLVWDKQHNGFVLVDLKTTKAAGLPYIERDGAKPEHIAQISAYWWAFVNQGYPMLEKFGVLYVPMDDDYSIEFPGPQPIMAEVAPLDFAALSEEMDTRKALVDEYLASVPAAGPESYERWTDAYLTDALAEPMAREQKLFKDKDRYNLTLVPHWSAMFCPYDDTLCPCGGLEGEPKTTKIGHFEKSPEGWVYVPRAGYEDREPQVFPHGRVTS